jgi:N-acetylmuramoyl-L-alanine amidase
MFFSISWYKASAIAIMLILIFFIKSCAKLPLPPPSKLEFHKLDTRALEDKIIVIDPGHGGAEHGAVGSKGLRESEINLTVSLYLWGLLKQAGARPVLTRTSDLLLTEGPDYSLQKELKARADFSNKQGADLFISIHHNSDAEDRSRNDLQVYYKLSDSGASRDVAQEVLNSLKQRLRQPQGELLPGNYAVLRNTRSPAILGEASFLTNTDNEISLTFHRTLLNEAEAYFLGILNYYNKGVPEVTQLYPRKATVTDTQPEIKAHISPGNIGEDIQPEKIIFTLNNEFIKDSFALHDNRMSYKPSTPLPNGRYEYCISYHNKEGNSSQKKCAFFVVASPPCTMKITPVFTKIPPEKKFKIPFDIGLLDCLNRPVADNTEVLLFSSAGILSTSTIQTTKGKARVYLMSDRNMNEAHIHATSGAIQASATVAFDIPESALFMADIKNSSGEPIERVKLRRQGSVVSLSDAQGFVYDTVDSSGLVQYEFSKRGYESLTHRVNLVKGNLTRTHTVLIPVDNGFFLNRIIMINREDTFHELAPLITALKEKLEYAGCLLVLSKENDLPEEKVIKASEEKASVFLTIEVTEDTLSVEHYFRSINGKRLAESICQGFKKDKNTQKSQCRTLTSRRFLIIHTEMPAIHLSIPQHFISFTDTITSVIYQALYEMFSS